MDNSVAGSESIVWQAAAVATTAKFGRVYSSADFARDVCEFLHHADPEVVAAVRAIVGNECKEASNATTGS